MNHNLNVQGVLRPATTVHTATLQRFMATLTDGCEFMRVEIEAIDRSQAHVKVTDEIPPGYVLKNLRQLPKRTRRGA